MMKLTVTYLAQAGFLLKSATGKTVCVDPYLSDCCERMFGFKRMIPAPLAMAELRADFLVSTHSHADHLDPDLLEVMRARPETRFVGSPDCLPLYQGDKRATVLAAGESATIDGVNFRAVYADHGELAPDAVGFLITLDGVTFYDTGDTAYRPEKILASLGSVKVDIMVVPINSAYGNLGHENAVKLAALVKPRVVIGSHFGMFVEHGGDPAPFLDYARKTLPETITPMVMAPGEILLHTHNQL